MVQWIVKTKMLTDNVKQIILYVCCTVVQQTYNKDTKGECIDNTYLYLPNGTVDS